MEEFASDKNDYKIKFTFDANPFFTNTEIVKEVCTTNSCETSGTCTKIDWKPDKDVRPPLVDGAVQLTSTDEHKVASSSFFAWLTDCSDPNNDELVDVSSALSLNQPPR